MKNKEVEKFIEESKQAGFSYARIKQQLIDAGWDAHSVDVAMKSEKNSPNISTLKILTESFTYYWNNKTRYIASFFFSFPVFFAFVFIFGHALGIADRGRSITFLQQLLFNIIYPTTILLLLTFSVVANTYYAHFLTSFSTTIKKTLKFLIPFTVFLFFGINFLIAGGLVLLVIPGIVVMMGGIFTFYFYLEEKKSLINSLAQGVILYSQTWRISTLPLTIACAIPVILYLFGGLLLSQALLTILLIGLFLPFTFIIASKTFSLAKTLAKKPSEQTILKTKKTLVLLYIMGLIVSFTPLAQHYLQS